MDYGVFSIASGTVVRFVVGELDKIYVCYVYIQKD